MKVYELDCDFAFQSVTFESNDDKNKFDQLLYDDKFGKSVKSLWQPIRIKVSEGKETLPASDFPCFFPDLPIISSRAKEVLHDLIAPYVEFLPFQSSFGEYYGINVLEEVDALDEEASELKRFSSGRVMVVHKYVFKPDAVEGKVIFRLPQFQTRIYVTDLFAAKVREHGLKGLKLKELWSNEDCSKGQHRDLDDKKNSTDSQITSIDGRIFEKQVIERLKELISEKTGFSKDCVELGEVKISFKGHIIEALFWVESEEYWFSHNEAWGIGRLMKTVQFWDKEINKGE